MNDPRSVRKRRPRSASVAVGGLVACMAFASVAWSAPTAVRMGLLVPAYQYPTLGTLWADCAAAAPRLPLIAVLNPASGPDSVTDPTYTTAVAAVRAGGGRVIAYITSSYAAVSADSILDQVDLYRAQYALDGIFIDEMSNSPGLAVQMYYAAIRDSIAAREPGWLVVGNPGVNTLEPYLDGADVLVNHEFFGESYFSWTPSAWVPNHSPMRFCHLVHTLSTADSMRAAVARAASQNAAWVFVTDDVMVNPWDATPAYWSALVFAAESTLVSGTAGVDPGEASIRRMTASPNPASGLVRFAAFSAGSPLRLEILDVSGRIVRRIASSGAPSLTWDGRDSAGRLVPAGVYLARDPSEPALRVRVVRVR